MKTTRSVAMLQRISAVGLLCLTSNVFAAPTTNGNVIEILDEGWHQVQRADNFVSICEGVTRCEETPGEYIVINHTSGERFKISVANASTTNTVNTVNAISVSANVIQWPDDGWYQVQNAATYESVCEGGRSCTVANGRYIVINHTSGERNNNVSVNADLDIVSPIITQPDFDLVAPKILPARCIGSIDSANTRFCVDPETRLFSATDENGSRRWSYTLPGANDNNQIETVLTTDQWLIIVADKYPELDNFTVEQRSNQYEASLFNKNGAFVRTVPLTIDLMVNDSGETRHVNSRFSSGALKNPLAAIATESDAGNPLLVIGWNRWRTTVRPNTDWDFSAVSVYDLASGALLKTNNFVQNGISELSLLKGERDIVRVTTDLAVYWKYIDNLNFVHPSYFSQFAPDALIKPNGNVDSQFHAGNYLEVINRVLPWINGDVANDILFGSVSDQPPGSLPITDNEFSTLSQYDDDDYTNTNFQCFNGGEVLRRRHKFVPISMHIFDHCEFGDKTFEGKLLANYVGRDGFGVRGENLTAFRSDNSVTKANIGHSVSFTRIVSGSSRSFFGSMAGYGESAQGKNVSVGDYTSLAQFFYGPDIGNETCVVNYDRQGLPIQTLNCK